MCLPHYSKISQAYLHSPAQWQSHSQGEGGAKVNNKYDTSSCILLVLVYYFHSIGVKAKKTFSKYCLLLQLVSCFHSSGKTIFGQIFQKLDQHSVSGPKTKLLCGFISASLSSKSASFCGDSWKKSPSCCSRWLLQGRT